MRAAVFRGPGSIELMERPDPTPGPGEVLLKVEATTLCGTDLRILTGEKSSGVKPDTIMGHEIAGRVEALGEGVTGYDVGAQAAVGIVVSCNRCRLCQLNLEHVCENLELIGYGINGGFADWMVVPAKAVAHGNLVQTEQPVDPTHLALAEPLSCCLNGFGNYRVNPTDTVVILGAGAIGLLHTQLARLAGARQIIVSNRSEARREVAKRVGATHVVAPDEMKATVAELTHGLGADVVVQCFGSLDLANEALQLARCGGRVNYFAGFPKGSTAPIDVNLIHYNELQVTGGSNARRADVVRAVRLLESGKLDAGAVVTHTFALADIDQAYAAVKDKLGLKIAVTP